MPARRRTRLWIAGVVGLAAVAGAAAVVTLAPKARRGTDDRARLPILDPGAPVSTLIQPLREGDGQALAVIFQRTAAAPGATVVPPTEDEAAQWVAALKAVGAGFPKYGSYGRASALAVAGRFLHRLAAEPAPANWVDALQPAHDLFGLGLEDASLDVRASALNEVATLWSWVPGRSLLPAEESSLADWKQGLTGPVIRRLGDREPKARAAAIACLGRLPIDALAAPAVASLDDPRSPEVRNQVLVSFAGRPALLSDDAVLKHIYDKDPVVGESARTVLSVRGLTQEQISLGSMIFHPKPEIRASVVPLLIDRADIDPVVWLLQLSRDDEPSVRLRAVKALAHRHSPESVERLAEMAEADPSLEVRLGVSALVPPADRTASLPPLPGSPSLNPKAN